MAQGCATRYRARNPRETPLYGLCEAHFDEVRGQWEERFERRCGFWRGFVDEQVRRYLDCGLFENGFARIRCPDCAEEYLLAFSCKSRELCPSCAAKRSAATAALLAEEVFEEVGHAQWVFVMPKMLRPYFLHHRELLGGLAHAAWETVLELMIVAMGAPRRDVPGTALCRNGYPLLRRASHNADAGHSAGSAPHSGCSGSDGGRRRVISVVAELPTPLRTTTLMARRWGAKGGPEGRSFPVGCSQTSGPSSCCRGGTPAFRSTTG